MRVDILKLHCPEEDTNIRRCLRIYTILPRFCKEPGVRNAKAKEILEEIQQVRDKMKTKYGIKWGYVWMKSIPYKMSYAAIKDWMIGRASIPVVAIESLKKIGFEKEAGSILSKAEYFASTTHDIVRIPKKLSPDIFYLSGLILGDGCLPDKKRGKENNLEYGFSIVSGQEEFLNNKIRPIIEENFQTTCGKLRYYNHGGPTWCLEKRNKALHRFFTKIMGLPHGKKSEKAHIPNIVKEANDKEKIAFLCGLIDSDIGKHSGGMGCTFRSKKIVEDLIEFLRNLGIEARSSGTHYKNNRYEQNDFRILKSQVKTLKELLLRNYLPKRKDRIETINELAGIG